MSDEAYYAKEWLSRTNDITEEIEAEKRLLLKIKEKLEGGVRSYDNIGSSHDQDASRKRHEDLLIQYSMQSDRIDQKEKDYLKELSLTRSIIDKLKNPIHRSIAVDRYINGMKWKDILNSYHYEQRQIFKIHEKLLEEVSRIALSDTKGEATMTAPGNEEDNSTKVLREWMQNKLIEEDKERKDLSELLQKISKKC